MRALASLGHRPLQLAMAVAVLGDEADVRRAATLAGIGVDEALMMADRLTEAGILRGVRPLAFSHPIARAAVYLCLPAGARSLAHRRAAGLLSDDGAPLEQIGSHLLMCEPAGDRAVVEWLIDAANWQPPQGKPSAPSGTSGGRSRSHRRSNGALEPRLLLGQLGVISDHPRALAWHERVAGKTPSHGSGIDAGSVRTQLAHIHCRRGALGEAEAHARASWNLLRGSGAEPRRTTGAR